MEEEILNMTKLEGLWIIKEFGFVLFSKSEHHNPVEQDLLGNLLIVAYHLSESKLQWFSIKRQLYGRFLFNS